MQFNRLFRLNHRLQQFFFILFISIIFALIAILSNRYHFTLDLTENARHSLSEASQIVLKQLKQPLVITAYATPKEELRNDIQTLIGLYQRYKTDIQLNFVNPLTSPAEIRQNNVRIDGELQLHYQGRTEQIQELTEQAITEACVRLLKADQQKIVFLAGHGERSADLFANDDMTDWADSLRSHRFNVQSHQFSDDGALPKDTQLLVIASPRAKLLEGEVQQILNYMQRGGNLLWFLEPADGYQGLEPIAQLLGLELNWQTVIDLSGQQFGVKNPSFITVTRYSPHPMVENFNLLTLFPEAVAISAHPSSEWSQSPLFYTSNKAWLISDVDIQQNSELKPKENAQAEFVLGLSLTRTVETLNNEIATPSTILKEQRIALIGDGDFLSNTYLNNSGNLTLGMRMVHWLTKEDNFIEIPTKTKKDVQLKLTENQLIALGAVFLFFLPITFISLAFLIRWLRRNIS